MNKEKNLKVGIIVKYFPTISETFIVNQINSLIDAGFRIQLFAYKKGSDTIVHESLLTHDLIHNVNYFLEPSSSKIKRVFQFLSWLIKHFWVLDWLLLFKVLNVFKFGKDAYTLKLFFESQWFLLNNDFDVIHVHFGPNAKRIAHLKAIEVLNKQTHLVCTFHGYDLAPNKFEFYKKEYQDIFEWANILTVNSQYLKNLLLELNPDLKNVSILPVGLDTSFFKRTNPKREGNFFDIIFCGRLIPLKGPDLAVDCINYLNEKGYNNVRLRIIGNGKLKPILEEKIKAFGLGDRVFIYGSLSQEDVKKHLEQSDVFLLPGRCDLETGRAETQGLVIQEAQAMQLPVIVSDVGGVQYGMKDGETGFLVKENNIEDFVSCLENLILNYDLKLKMGNRGRVFVKTKFDNSVLVKKLIKTYTN